MRITRVQLNLTNFELASKAADTAAYTRARILVLLVSLITHAPIYSCVYMQMRASGFPIYTLYFRARLSRIRGLGCLYTPGIYSGGIEGLQQSIV